MRASTRRGSWRNLAGFPRHRLARYTVPARRPSLRFPQLAQFSASQSENGDTNRPSRSALRQRSQQAGNSEDARGGRIAHRVTESRWPRWSI